MGSEEAGTTSSIHSLPGGLPTHKAEETSCVVALDTRDKTTTPTISVILISYRKRPYLYRAIQSVQQQSLDTSKFEVIWVTHFDDWIARKLLTPMNTLILISSTRSLSGQVAEAITYSRGKVVSFLDDDDEFCSDKLRRVLQISHSTDHFCYYNAQILIDSNGATIGRVPSLHLKSKSRSRRTKVRKIGPSEIAGVSNLPSFNASSLAISREVVFKYINQLKTLRSTNLDIALVCFAVSDSVTFFIDSHPLTKYRVHGDQAVSVKDDVLYRGDIMWNSREAEMLADFQLLISLCPKSKYAEMLYHYSFRYRVTFHLYHYTSKVAYLQKLYWYFKRGRPRISIDTIMILQLSCVYLLSPRAIDAMVRRFRI